jgi:hypothetical protein
MYCTDGMWGSQGVRNLDNCRLKCLLHLLPRRYKQKFYSRANPCRPTARSNVPGDRNLPMFLPSCSYACYTRGNNELGSVLSILLPLWTVTIRKRNREEKIWKQKHLYRLYLRFPTRLILRQWFSGLCPASWILVQVLSKHRCLSRNVTASHARRPYTSYVLILTEIIFIITFYIDFFLYEF